MILKKSSTPFKRKPTAPTTTATTAVHATTPAVTPTAAPLSVFDQLPDSAWVRESQLVRKSNDPASVAPLCFSAPTLWRKVRDGSFPAPSKLSARVTAWRVGTVRSWMAQQTAA